MTDSDAISGGGPFLSHSVAHEETQTNVVDTQKGAQRNNKTNAPRRRILKKTKYRGVIQWEGAGSGTVTYMMQFVFCDHGVKKHPKIYGFTSLEQAAMAFDILLIKRTFEKGERNVKPLLIGEGDVTKIETSLPGEKYADDTLLELIERTQRNGVIFAIKENVGSYGSAFEASQWLPFIIEKMEEWNTLDDDSKKSMMPKSYEPILPVKKRVKQAEADLSAQQVAPQTALNSASQGDLRFLPFSFLETNIQGSDGFIFLLELCKLAVPICLDLLPAVDLLKIWVALSNAAGSDCNSSPVKDIAHSTAGLSLPAQAYDEYLDRVRGAKDLVEAMGVCLDLWKSKALFNIISQNWGFLFMAGADTSQREDEGAEQGTPKRARRNEVSQESPQGDGIPGLQSPLSMFHGLLNHDTSASALVRSLNVADASGAPSQSGLAFEDHAHAQGSSYFYCSPSRQEN